MMTFKSITISLLCIWVGVLPAVLPGAVFGQANYATPYTVTTIAGRAGIAGTTSGTNGAARFDGPAAVAVDSETNVYVGCVNNGTLRKVTPAGTNWVVTTIIGGLSGPGGIAIDTAGELYVSELLNNTISKVEPDGTNWVVTTIAGKAGTTGSADGLGSAARFNGPNALAIDGAGNLYVPDTYNYTIRKIAPNGTNWVVTTIAGKAGTPGSADGLGSAARFYWPETVAVDSATNVYVADTGNGSIRKVTPVGTNWDVTTLAAGFYSISSIAVDSATNLYVTDNVYNIIDKVKLVENKWLTTTIAGRTNYTGSADGLGIAARFNSPNDVALDSAGNVYVADTSNDTIRKLSPPLMITSSGPSLGFNSGQFAFALNGLGGQTVVVDASSDLENWSPIWTNTLTFPAPINFTDPEPSASINHFYRARTP
jgi:streptogramin lyase